MSTKSIKFQQQMNYVSRFLKIGEMKHLNCIRIGPNEGDKHFAEKIRRCREYKRIGTAFLTEARLSRGGIADILLPQINLIEEILVSETETRFKEKEEKYHPFRIIAVRI